MSETVTHIAGVAITIGSKRHGGFKIQRCSVCGEVLVDSRGTMAPIEPDGTVPEVPAWETGRMVRVHAGNPTHYEGTYILASSS